jgi:hypothetical protein
MHEILLDIRQRLVNKEYHNEEHVRLSLVARVVQALGWDIWNPTEVYTEFKATKKEDNTRVDVALFTRNFEELYGHAKRPGKLDRSQRCPTEGTIGTTGAAAAD